ncbi:MAG: helix-turn-helix transcriptional regulator [Sphingobacteriales bacterium]|jgi:AraC-like DNA-binding protein|nr:helix-turn-helix transcriptional regulator [Sphingobacteriales bacterium]
MKTETDAYFPSEIPEILFLKCIWRLQEYHSHQKTETILPKGTVEIIFNLSESIIYNNPAINLDTQLPPCFINGINFKPFHLKKMGQQYFLGIQLNTIGLKLLFDIPLSEFADNFLDASLICNHLDDLTHKLFSKTEFGDQVFIIRKWLYQQISTSKHQNETFQIHNLFYNQKQLATSVLDLSKCACISDRQLRRISSEWLGMNTEAFVSYNKYLHSLNLLHHSNKSLTQIGLEAGYYDQSHFIRNFKSYTGLTPKEYQALCTSVPGHIYK